MRKEICVVVPGATNVYAYASYGDNDAFNRDASNRTVVAGVRHRF